MRLIDADKIMADIATSARSTSKDYSLLSIARYISIQPTIDAEPVRHGHWKRKLDTRFGEKLNDIIGCSECNIYFSTIDMIRRSYCPNCGAKMDEED